jgi:hypothetical protein
MSSCDGGGEVVSPAKRRRRFYLLISNPSKTTHLGTLIRCAAAFGVHQLLLVGHDKFNCRGSFGSHQFLDILCFRNWDRVQEYLQRGGDIGSDESIKEEDGSSKCNGSEESHPQRNPIDIIGILGAYGGGDEIFSHIGVPVYECVDDETTSLVIPKESNCDVTCHLPIRSYPVHTRPFSDCSDDVCFLLSRGNNLPISQARICTGFVHVPHLSIDDDDDRITQSNLLDMVTTLSIVLHHFTAWAGYVERSVAENQKFVKDAKPCARRRLCRVVDQSDNIKNANDVDDVIESMESMTMWNDNCGDY